MLYIRNSSNDPYFNMALEEYVIKNMDPAKEYFILWQNRPTVVIGKNQNAIEEVNLEYVKENNIAVVRRLSGGGAVYHDLGNVNFTYVVDYRPEFFNSIERFAQAVVKALEKLGIKAEFTGRNDITIEGRKISGNAQFLYKRRLLHHGTLLFDSDLTRLSSALNVKPQKIASKGVKSVKSRVANIKEYLKEDISVEGFKELLLKYIFEVEGQSLIEYNLTPEDLERINRLRDEKYATWDWNFGTSPEFDLIKSQRFDAGEIEVRINVRDGRITDIKFYGDFLSMRDVSEVEEKLKGLRYKEEDVGEALKSFNLKEYFGGITFEEILKVMF
ncbi:lipoate--protein ligase [Thermovenabulum gondwanense]|uniref:lipoate--protein ligase n=1 Tax=Thermovenabulum gondwanense TaxID=520767 RepID=A0A161PVM5_9FIRM|nr:lipoate--protein ligase [Thermovenabulum gondwanense]KYO67005.1 Lipoate-protein ligase LplJ [Thermovenabulum gondwanense]